MAVEGSDPARRIPSISRPIAGLACWSAATRYRKKRPGSSSASSSVSHATGRFKVSSHSPAQVVLPNPAGAEKSVRVRPAVSPSFRRRTSCGRAIRPKGTAGRCSLVESRSEATGYPEGERNRKRLTSSQDYILNSRAAINRCHCEERSDEAIFFFFRSGDCFAPYGRSQ